MHPVVNTPFLFCEARSAIDGAGFIMCCSSPFPLGRILKFTNNDSYLSNMANSQWPCVPVNGYRILIQFAGSMVSGRRLILIEPDMGTIQNTLLGMADFFMREKVNLHTSYYKKFLITPDSKQPGK